MDRLLDDMSRPDSAVDTVDASDDEKVASGSELGEESDKDGGIPGSRPRFHELTLTAEPIPVPVAMWVRQLS